jgi:hypothetical protein
MATYAYTNLSGNYVYVDLSELNSMGPWSALTSYAANDYVSYGNSLYVALGTVAGVAPTTTQLWSTLALVYGTGGASPLPPLHTLPSAGTLQTGDLILVERGGIRYSYAVSGSFQL